jgi:hypothetical protein
MKRMLLGATLGLVGLLAVASAEARTDRLLTYRPNQAWASAVRFLRVDMGYRILERDREAGYLLFEYQEGGRTHNGSLEMIRVVETGRRYLRARLQIPSMPSYVEVVLFDKFERKLRNEYGDPPPAAMATTPVPAGSAGEGAAKAQPSAKQAPPGSEDDAEIGDEDLEDAVLEEGEEE